MLQIIAWLLGRKILVLEDMDGCIYNTLERKTVFGNKAYVYWYTQIGSVNLEADGTCTGLSSSYIKKWTYK